MKLNEVLKKLSLKILEKARNEVKNGISHFQGELDETNENVRDLKSRVETSDEKIQQIKEDLYEKNKTIKSLEENVGDMEITMSNFKESEEKTNKNIKELTDTTNSQKNDIIDNANEIGKLKKNKAYLSNRFFVFIGDSYMYGYYPDNSKKKLTGYVDRAKARTGLRGSILACGGEGFAKSGPYGKFLNRIKEFTGDKSQVTDVVVLGGYNDHDMSVSEISEGIKEFCNYVSENFPIAKVTIGMVGWTTSASRYYELRRVLYTYIDAASANKCAFIPNLEFVMHHTELFSSDGLHPNEDGHGKLSAALTSWIMGGGVDVAYGYQAVNYTVSGGFSLGTTSFYSQLQNGTCSLLHSDCVGVSCNVTQSQWNGFHSTRMQLLTITGKTNLEGANFTGDVKTSQSSAMTTVSSSAQIGGKWCPCTLIIELISSAMFISIIATGDSGYMSGTCTGFILPSFQIVALSMCA